MKKYYYPARETWEALCERPSAGDDEEIRGIVADIIENVKRKGDSALEEYSMKFDGIKLTSLKVSDEEIERSAEAVPSSLKKSIDIAKRNIEKFHAALIHSDSSVITSIGIKCWRRCVPIEKVGLYIPGGSAPLFSTVLMLGIPARLAGCREIILCSPPDKEGNINPLILYTARLLDIRNIYRIGGAQAIAAMAFGTETIPGVYKIFGPGNRYVTKAKEIVQEHGVAIDMPAGPSEVLVIAGKEARADYIAADLLSQAEHGPDSQTILVTDSADLIDAVESEIQKQLNLLPRKKIAEKAMSNSMAVLLNSLDDCIRFSNVYAPEHLIINTPDCHRLAEKVSSAGSVFIGEFSCESMGDYASGPNHTLPTNGYARSFSGLSVDNFLKQIFFQEVTRDGLATVGPAVIEMAEAEQLKAHSNAVKIRL
ncbi:MAG TPA: histidinol dehydrogenase [Bacteroidales bacterium]|nr:histidinol dehydrogenase [Bacteroidales bacterium]